MVVGDLGSSAAAALFGGDWRPLALACLEGRRAWAGKLASLRFVPLLAILVGGLLLRVCQCLNAGQVRNSDVTGMEKSK